MTGTNETAGRRLLVIGAGGHAKVVIEVARAAGWTPVAALDPRRTSDVLGVPVQGTDDDIAAFWARGAVDGAVVAIGENRIRQALAHSVRGLGCPTVIIVHPAAVVAASARIGDGVVVMAGAIINADASIGRDCIINTAAIVEHDCILEEGVHAAPRSVMGGTCRLGRGTLFGIGATVRPGIAIGKGVMVGAGAVVVSDIADYTMVVGNPARPFTGPQNLTDAV
jgi:UDP-perosamine 4-acetyltransferase